MLLENLFPAGKYGLNQTTFSVQSGMYDIVVATKTAVVWSLTAAGATLAASITLSEAVSGTSSAAGTANGATVSVAEYGLGEVVHKTVLTLSATPQTVTNGTEYQGTLVYTFPEGRILLLGSVMTMAQTTTSALASTLNASSTGALAVGTATASNVSLTGSMVNLMPSTAFTSSATINVAGTAVSAALAASAQFDGTTTAVPVYVNTAYATTTDVDATATQTLSGTLTLVWTNLGDY